MIAIIAILAAILFPLLVSAREAGKKARCAAQARELGQAVLLYVDDNNGRYPVAARDIDGPGGGLQRWHGVRTSITGAFDPKRGPLWVYFGRSGGLKMCPGQPRLEGIGTSPNAFEAGCGGYGYNSQYVGGTAYKNSFPKCFREASSTSDIRTPARTLMFADTAMAQVYPQPHLVEYSFAEPPLMPNATPGSDLMSPSIHFRHNNAANIVWCDGHVSSEMMSFTAPTNAYGAENAPVKLGWFGPKDNSLFDNR